MTRRSQACSAERMERWLRRAGMRLGWLASKSTSDQSDDFVRFVSERAPRAACGRPESLRHGSCVPPTSGRLEPFGGHNHGPEGSDPSTRAFNSGPPGSTNPVRTVTPRQYLGTRDYHCSYQRGKNGPVGDDVSRPRGTVGRHHKPVSLTMGQDVRMGRMI
jgi:hypothetical protein